jgi:hypothetical protein
MHDSKIRTIPRSSCRNMVTRSIAAIVLMMITVPVFAQNLAIKNFDGEVFQVGEGKSSCKPKLRNQDVSMSVGSGKVAHQ